MSTDLSLDEQRVVLEHCTGRKWSIDEVRQHPITCYHYQEESGRMLIAEGINHLHAAFNCYLLAKLGSKIPKGKGEWI